MNVKIGTIRLTPVPDSIIIQSPQKIAELEIPNLQNILQDFGPGAKKFSLSGVIRRRDGGLTRALADLDKTKQQGREVIFAIDRNSWKVRIQNIDYIVIRLGHIRYTITMQETSRAKTTVYVSPAAINGPDAIDFYIAQAKARARLFSLRGALNRIYNSFNKIDTALAQLRSIIRDVNSLIELPVNLINRTKFELSMIILHCEIIKLEAQKIIDSPRRTYSAWEDMLAYVYQYVQLACTESALMWAKADALPLKEKNHTVALNDTLQSISLLYYGTVSRWTDIAFANKITDPTSIKVGDILTIPQ